jgi:hypothetical protein
VTWNTQSCKGLDGSVSRGAIVEHARALADFDVLCLQEIADGYRAHRRRRAGPACGDRGLLPGFRVFFGPAVDEFDADGSRGASATWWPRGCRSPGAAPSPALPPDPARIHAAHVHRGHVLDPGWAPCAS